MPKKRPDGYYLKQVTYYVNGNRVKKSFYYRSDNELRSKQKAFEEQLSVSESHLFTSVADEWQEEHFKKIQGGTRISYSPAISRAKDWFGDIPIKEIKPLDIQRILDDLASKKYSQQTVRVQRNVLNLIFKYAILREYIDVNPVDSTRVPRNLNKSKRTVPEQSDIDAILSSTDKDFGLFAYLLLLTGCRRGEALALQWKDFDGDVAHIYKQVTYSGDNQNQPVLTEHTKTEAGIRDVFIPDVLKEKLKPTSPDDFVFGGKAPLTKSSFRKKWDRYVKETGINLTPHQLRHAYATFLYESDVPVKEAQQIMGHASVKVTQDIYTHIRERRQEKTNQKINEYLSQMQK